MQERKQKGRFLDVSEFMLKEFSPLQRASNPDFRQTQRVSFSFIMKQGTRHVSDLTVSLPLDYLLLIQNYPNERNTPQIEPIDHDASNMKITPFLNGLIEIADNQLEDFRLDVDDPMLEGKPKDRLKAQRHGRHRSNSLILFNLQHDLEDIVEEFDSEFCSYEDSNSYPFEVQQESEQDELSEQGSEQMIEFDLARLRTQTQYRQKMDRYVKQPKSTLTKDIRRIAFSKDLGEIQKMEEIKSIIKGYIVDFQIPCFQESWQENTGTFQEKVELICKGIDQNFSKTIGELTFESRRIKLLKYLEKKKLRKWRKKVSYDCRKKVADSRLRIKGKFVTREQVCDQLGIANIEVYTGQEIKQLLEKRKEGERERSVMNE